MEKAQTLQDIMRHRGITEEMMSKARREAERKEVGCVIRALESVTSAKATDEEWEMRLSSIRGAETLSDLIVRGAASAAEIKRRIALDVKEVWELMENLSARDTSLGTALRRMEVTEAQLSPREISKALKDGQKLLVIGGLQGELHIAHIEENRKGRIVSASDRNLELNLKEDRQYHVLVFTPRQQTKR